MYKNAVAPFPTPALPTAIWRTAFVQFQVVIVSANILAAVAPWADGYGTM